jgi:sortase A
MGSRIQATTAAHRVRFCIMGVLLMVAGSVSVSAKPAAPVPNSLPVLGGGSTATAAGSADFVLSIPSIDLELPVWEAVVRGDTWDFSVFTRQAAHLELTALPGQGSNVVIGAHYELADFVPGPFINLDKVPVGERIYIDYGDQVYVYEVSDTLLVSPADIEVAYRTPSEVLTLLTCYNYTATSGVYDQRYVVRAALVNIQ